MNPTLEKIIELYAEHGVERVLREPAFRDFVERHPGDAVNAMLRQVRDAADLLEEALSSQTPQDQVKFALQLLNTLGGAEQHEIFRALARRRYSASWSEEQRRYFDDASHKIENWRDYFLSFTNYNPTAGEVMYVNNKHRKLIRKGLGSNFEASTVQNMLARLLNYLLRNRSLNGFYYPSHRGPGNVEERLKREARQAFVFVQLVQTTMFERWPNFCKMEYDAAAEDDTRIFIFVMAEEREGFIRPERVHIELRRWHEAIAKDDDAVELEPTEETAVVRELLKEIEKRVVEPVEEARDSIFGNVPL